MEFMTVRISNWRHLIRTSVITTWILFLGGFIIAQEWELITQYPLEAPSRLIERDRFNNIYINDQKGNVFKLDSAARLVAQYAPPGYGLLTSMDPWSSLRVFLFYGDTQRYTFLDRYLSGNEFSEFPGGKFGMITLAAPSTGSQIWLLDLTPLNLIKYDMAFNSVTLSQPFNQLSDTINLQPYQLVEYQNRVFLGDRKIGILVFDNLGNYLRTIKKSGKEQFHFCEEQLYYLKGNQLHFNSIYENSEQSVEIPDRGVRYQHAVILNNRVALVSGNRLFIFKTQKLLGGGARQEISNDK